MDAVVVAQSILDCGDEAALRVLSLAPGLPPITADTPVAEARRNYMCLAALVHPDKLGGRFERSTEVFQKLVRAFEALADPKSRRRLQALQAREAKKAAKTGALQTAVAKKKITAVARKAATAADVSKAKPKRAMPQKTAVKRKRAAKDEEDDDDNEDDFIDYDEDEEGDDDDDVEEYDEEEMDGDFGDVEPAVSTSRALIGTKRSGGVYIDTPVSCPQCRTPWAPDSKQHYSLFMGPTGKKVHCETCLCRFGCATAMHACPHCRHAFDYDSTMYDSVLECAGCHKKFGFPYYPVNQYLIDQVKHEEWREQAEREKARERNERAARRRNNDDKTSDEFHSLVGSCIVNEMCPLCNSVVTSRHRQHIETCMKSKRTSSTPLKTTKSSAAATATKAVAKKETKKETTKAVVKKALTPKKSTPRNPAAKKLPVQKTKRRRREDSSDDESEDYDDDDDDDDDDSEESFAESSDEED